MTYVIKVYRMKNIKHKPIKTWDLEYVSTLPYRFNAKPVNIANQLDDMFMDTYQHIIDID